MIDLASLSRGWRSGGGFVLLTAVVTAFSVIVALMAIGEPSSAIAAHDVACQHLDGSGHEAEPMRAVSLPYSSPRDLDARLQTMRCRIAIVLTPDQAGESSLLILSFADKILVEVNGARALQAELWSMRALRWVAMPAEVPLDPARLHPGLNYVTVTVTNQAFPPGLGRIFVGRQEQLAPFYRARWFTAAVLPTILCGVEFALAIVFALIWAGRRHETAYGWLALFLFGGAMHGSVLIPDFGISDLLYKFWNLTAPWESLACLLFMRAIAKLPTRRRDWLYAVPPGLVSVCALTLAPSLVNGPVLAAGAAITLGNLVLGLIAVGRAGVRGNQDAVLVLIGMLVAFGFLAHDVIVIAGLSTHRAFIGRIGLGGFMITISTMMTLRFVRAMREVDHTADVLRERVDAAEAELRATYEELRVRREAEAVERERSRLMRDLHDGIGGELASMLALADSPRPRGAEIADHARAALSDMRLIISSLEDYGGDLALALGAWRERAAPQVRAAGLKLDWRVDDLPPIANLGPAQVLDILRIVQEAVTNTIKHARARSIALEARADADSLTISVRDDGAGTVTESRGHGMRNMAERAARLGATLDITRDEGGAQVLLRIPRIAGPSGS